MLIQTNKSQLGDGALDPTENLIKLKESNAAMSSKFRIPGQDELEDQERSAGPRMQSSELIRRLRLCNPNLHFRDGSPGSLALYVMKNRQEIAEDGIDPSKKPFFNDHKYVGGLSLEPMPEYSHVILDARGLPKREYKGWRGVLIALIKAGVISYRNAVKYFGEPTGERSSLWHQQLSNHK